MRNAAGGAANGSAVIAVNCSINATGTEFAAGAQAVKRVLLVLVFCSINVSASAHWKEIGPGVAYREWIGEGRAIYVTRVDLRNRKIEVISTAEPDRATTVSDYAARNNALIAVNADYFDEERHPLGLAVGTCGPWEGTADNARAGIFYVDERRGQIEPPADHREDGSELDAAVSGWPLLVKKCQSIPAAELPGSDRFTRAPHPRTAVGLSRDRRRFYLVVADGRREGVPGLTLEELGRFMDEELDVCTALNLDGGGSSAMWVAGCIVNVPSDGKERVVANHIGVVLKEDYVACNADTKVAPSYKATCPREVPGATIRVQSPSH